MNLKFLQESGKKSFQKYLKNGLGTKNVETPHILRTLPKFQVFFNFLKLFWVILYLVISHRHYINIKSLQ